MALKRVNFPACAFWSFALSVALLPIGLGGNRPIPIGVAQIGLSLSCFFLILSPDIWKQVHFSKRLLWALGFLTIVVVWALIQTQPLVPESWIHPIWHDVASALKEPVRGSISIAPEESLKGITRLITYIVGGFLAYVLAQDVRRARQFVQVFWLSGVIICLYGLIEQMAGLRQILWYDKWAYIDNLTATFVSRNHFAIYAGMVMSSGAALLFQSWRSKLLNAKPHQRGKLIREWLVQWGFHQWILLVLVLLCIILSSSRAGLVFSIIGLGSYFFFYQIYLRAWRRALMAGVIMLVVLALVATIAVFVSEHFAVLFEDYSSITRLKLYEMTWRIFRDNPWLGYGLNGFEPEYRLYQQGIREEFLHAHSDVMESFLDLGLPVGLLLWAAIGLMLNGLWNGIRRRRQNGMFPILGMAASVMALGHALVDFDLQIPGVALTWAALLGVGLAQSHGQSERRAIAGKSGGG